MSTAEQLVKAMPWLERKNQMRTGERAKGKSLPSTLKANTDTNVSVRRRTGVDERIQKAEDDYRNDAR